jgi:phosphoribosylanthranilate isomerase
MVVRAKICGIRSREDLSVALSARADAVGFICETTHRSEDELSPDAALALSRATPPYVSRVLVTHLESASEILQLARFVEVDTIQVHGLVSVETVAKVHASAEGRRVVAVVHVDGEPAVDAARSLLPVSDMLHLDSRSENRLGGTGLVHDWGVSRRISELSLAEAGRSVILAGGLIPENLAEAINTVMPYAVDANSGLDDENGDKDPLKADLFVAIAHSASFPSNA